MVRIRKIQMVIVVIPVFLTMLVEWMRRFCLSSVVSSYNNKIFSSFDYPSIKSVNDSFDRMRFSTRFLAAALTLSFELMTLHKCFINECFPLDLMY